MYPQKVKAISDTQIKIEFNHYIFDTDNAFYKMKGKTNLINTIYRIIQFPTFFQCLSSNKPKFRNLSI